MICEFCRANEANIHLVKIINGHSEKINLCVDCLKDFAVFPTEEIFNDYDKTSYKSFEVDIKIIDKRQPGQVV